MRMPMPGVLTARSKIRVTPSPAIGADETALVFSKSQEQVIKLTPANEAVILENLTDRIIPYVLVVIPIQAEANWNRFASIIQHLFTKKEMPQ